MSLGDVFSVVAALLGIGVTSWAFMVSCMLLFPARVERAAAVIERNAKSQFFLGLCLLVPAIVGVVLSGLPNPVLKLLGLALIVSVLAVGAVGAAGIGFIAGKRLQPMSPSMDAYPAFIRGSAFIVTASMLPVLGWFLFGPAALIVSLGAGARALTVRIARPPVVAGAF